MKRARQVSSCQCTSYNSTTTSVWLPAVCPPGLGHGCPGGGAACIVILHQVQCCAPRRCCRACDGLQAINSRLSASPLLTIKYLALVSRTGTRNRFESVFCVIRTAAAVCSSINHSWRGRLWYLDATTCQVHSTVVYSTSVMAKLWRSLALRTATRLFVRCTSREYMK